MLDVFKAVVKNHSVEGLDGRLSAVIDRYLDDEQPELEKNKPERTGFVFHPSQIHRTADVRDIQLDFLFPALRPHVKAFIKANNGINAKLRRIFDNGTMTHRRIQQYLAEISETGRYPFRLIEEEISIYNKEYRIGGNADGLIVFEGEKYILEIKTINTAQFKKLSAPLWKHVDQAHLYMFCTGVQQAIFLYEDKNTQELKDFVIEVDPVVMNILLEKLGRAREGIKEGVLLPYEMIGSTSRYNPFKGDEWFEVLIPGRFDWDLGKWID